MADSHLAETRELNFRVPHAIYDEVANLARAQLVSRADICRQALLRDLQRRAEAGDRD